MSRDFTKYSDQELVRNLSGSNGERDGAFAEIYMRYSKRIFMYCRRILGDEQQTEDVFQETFLSLLNNASGNSDIRNLPAYLLRIARNQCFKLKRNKMYNYVQIEDLDFGIEASAIEEEEIVRMVTRSLELLPEEHREAVVLQVYNDMSYNEIAEILEVPVSTVRNWVVRGKKMLRDILAPYFESSRN
jgi:RNA polymerase sigma-70 factor (ECF subfamily)